MSICYVTEFADFVQAGGPTFWAKEPAVNEQFFSFTGTAGTSTAFKSNTQVVRITVDGVANVTFGTSPTAVAGQNRRFSIGQTEYFIIPQGQSWKVSAVTAPA